MPRGQIRIRQPATPPQPARSIEPPSKMPRTVSPEYSWLSHVDEFENSENKDQIWKQLGLSASINLHLWKYIKINQTVHLKPRFENENPGLLSAKMEEVYGEWLNWVSNDMKTSDPWEEFEVAVFYDNVADKLIKMIMSKHSTRTRISDSFFKTQRRLPFDGIGTYGANGKKLIAHVFFNKTDLKGLAYNPQPENKKDIAQKLLGENNWQDYLGNLAKLNTEDHARKSLIERERVRYSAEKLLNDQISKTHNKYPFPNNKPPVSNITKNAGYNNYRLIDNDDTFVSSKNDVTIKLKLMVTRMTNTSLNMNTPKTQTKLEGLQNNLNEEIKKVQQGGNVHLSAIDTILKGKPKLYKFYLGNFTTNNSVLQRIVNSIVPDKENVSIYDLWSTMSECEHDKLLEDKHLIKIWKVYSDNLKSLHNNMKDHLYLLLPSNWKGKGSVMYDKKEKWCPSDLAILEPLLKQMDEEKKTEFQKIDKVFEIVNIVYGLDNDRSKYNTIRLKISQIPELQRTKLEGHLNEISIQLQKKVLNSKTKKTPGIDLNARQIDRLVDLYQKIGGMTVNGNENCDVRLWLTNYETDNSNLTQLHFEGEREREKRKNKNKRNEQKKKNELEAAKNKVPPLNTTYEPDNTSSVWRNIYTTGRRFFRKDFRKRDNSKVDTMNEEKVIEEVDLRDIIRKYVLKHRNDATTKELIDDLNGLNSEFPFVFMMNAVSEPKWQRKATTQFALLETMIGSLGGMFGWLQQVMISTGTSIVGTSIYTGLRNWFHGTIPETFYAEVNGTMKSFTDDEANSDWRTTITLAAILFAAGPVIAAFKNRRGNFGIRAEIIQDIGTLVESKLDMCSDKIVNEIQSHTTNNPRVRLSEKIQCNSVSPAIAIYVRQAAKFNEKIRNAYNEYAKNYNHLNKQSRKSTSYRTPRYIDEFRIPYNHKKFRNIMGRGPFNLLQSLWLLKGTQRYMDPISAMNGRNVLPLLFRPQPVDLSGSFQSPHNFITDKRVLRLTSDHAFIRCVESCNTSAKPLVLSARSKPAPKHVTILQSFMVNPFHLTDSQGNIIICDQWIAEPLVYRYRMIAKPLATPDSLKQVCFNAGIRIPEFRKKLYTEYWRNMVYNP